MTRVDELGLVVELASLTFDRTRDEQRALLHFAWEVDKERNAHVVTNKRWRDGERLEPLSRLVESVHESWEPSEGNTRCPLSTKEHEAIARAFARWEAGK